MKLRTIIVGFVVILIVFIALSAFKQKDEKMAKTKYENLEETEMMTGFRFQTLKEFIYKKDKEPEQVFEFEKFNKDYYETINDSSLSITWFGHSSSLLEIEGKLILLDPVFSNNVGPTKAFATKRFHKIAPISVEQLPDIDLILISHDHYDHLDKETIVGLNEKTQKFIVPEGVTQYLLDWGIPGEKVVTLNWWKDHQTNDLQIVSTPARHFSGRGILDRNTTLWCSYVIKGKEKSVYFSGDSGYSKEFKTIGQKYGPFDLSIMECGQYNEDWRLIHMLPAETVQASIDLQSKLVLPIHWGAFSLAVHSWYEPVEIFAQEAQQKNVNYITPKIGSLTIVNGEVKTEHWWEDYKVMQ